MKKLFTFVLSALFVAGMLSTASAQLRFGLKAGLNLATIAGGDEILDGFDPKMIPTYHIGGLAEFSLGENLGVGVGVQISGKGFKIEEEDDLGEYKLTSRPLYLQVPVSLHYTSNGFFVGAGPYAGFGIGGKNKETSGGESVSYDIEFGDGSGDDDVYAPLDFGLGLEAGYTINNSIRITASYNLGLANILPKEYREDEEGNFSIKHRVIGISAAYLFGGE